MAVLIHSASIVECLLYTRLHDWRWRFRNEQNTVCPMRIQVPHTPTFKLQNFKDANVSFLHVQSGEVQVKLQSFCPIADNTAVLTISHLSCLFP